MDKQNRFCSLCHFISVIDSSTDYPNNLTVGCGKYLAFIFLAGCHLLIHKEIAQQLGAFHPQRMESVADLPFPYYQGKSKLIIVQLGHLGRFIDNEMLVLGDLLVR